MVLQGKDAHLLQKLVSHKELLGCSRDVSVAVLDSHASESGLLDLEGDAPGEVHVDLSLLGGVDAGVSSGSEDVEALVSNLVHHVAI